MHCGLQCENSAPPQTLLTSGFSAGWSTRVVHERTPLQVPKGEEINAPLSKADLHQSYLYWKPTQASEVVEHLKGNGPVTWPRSSPVVNSDILTSVILLDILSLTPVIPRPCEKCFLLFIFVMGHECFFYNDTKINKKDKTRNHGSKEGFFLPQILTRQVYCWSGPDYKSSGKGAGLGLLI